MKTHQIFLSLMIATGASAQLATNVTITNLSGRVYANVTLDRTNKLGIIWIKADGNTGILKFKDLPADVLAQYGISTSTVQAAIASEQKAKAQWDARANADAAQMKAAAEQAAKQALGMELTASLIKNFPEKVRNQRGYMDVEFVELHPPSGDGLVSSQTAAEMALNVTVKDKNDDWFYDCEILKDVPRDETKEGESRWSQANMKPNPVAAVAARLKRGDKIRLTGMVSELGLSDKLGFFVGDIKLLSSAQ
jgi:hypothetical protein